MAAPGEPGALEGEVGGMKILALDTATKTGWAIWDGDRILESGVQDFTKRRGESNGLMFLRFRKWLYSLCETVMPDLIAYEQAHHRGGAATEIGVNLTGRVQEIAAAMGVETVPVATGTLKKFATGRGNAEKTEMIEAAFTFLGRDPLDDNEADAVHLARFAAQEYA